MSRVDELPLWCHQRPATTIVGTFRPEVVSGPGYRKKGDASRQNAEGSVVTSVEERAALQSYPPLFKFEGSKSAVNLQLGNAVPPLLARAILESLWKESA